MKKIIKILSVFAMIAAVVPAYASENGVDIISDGITVKCDPPAMVYNQRTMVPLRAVSESIGCEVEWNDETDTAVITDTKKDAVLTVKVDDSIMKKSVSGTASDIEIDTPAMISENRIFIPVRAVSEALDITVEWDGETRTVFMYTDIQKFNKYNIKEFNPYGQTIGQIASGMGGTYADFKEMYGLPEDMTEDTYVNVAERYIKISNMMELNQIDILEFREMYGAGEEITEDDFMGDVTDSMPLSLYIGEEKLDSFKEKYGFGDEITSETKWGEIRRIVEKNDYIIRVNTYGEDKPEDPDEVNIYNEGEYDVYGQTVGEVAAGMGGTFIAFKEMYGLPEDMRKDTYINVAERYIKVSSMLSLNQISIEEFREVYGVGEEITEESLMGDATDSMTLEKYIGAESLEAFKAEYGLGDEVTLQTKWGDIRKTVEKQDYEKRIAQSE